jgi:hypothetical protein
MDPRWSPVFRWWVQAPPGGWPKETPGLLDAHPDDFIVETLLQLPDQEFEAFLTSFTEKSFKFGN